MNILKIQELAKIAHEKRTHFKNLGIINTETDPKKREAQVIEYEVARGEMYKADLDLLREQTGDKAMRQRDDSA